MPLQIFPSSPMPGLTRVPGWQERQIIYDSGKYQGSSPLVKPLYNYRGSYKNRPIGPQTSLAAFINTHKKVDPFLFKDPYLNRADNLSRVFTDVTSFYLYDADSFWVIPDSASLLITSTLSGELTNGSEYILDQDTGIIVNSIAVTSDTLTWSCSYFKKGVFQGQYSESSMLWENFDISFVIQEII
jgi:hypothetical protein